jgi:hypothetical protein
MIAYDPTAALDVVGWGKFSSGTYGNTYYVTDPSSGAIVTFLDASAIWNQTSTVYGLSFRQTTDKPITFSTGSYPNSPPSGTWTMNMAMYPYHYSGQDLQKTIVFGTFVNASDRDVKSDIEDLPATELDRVMQLHPASYTARGNERGRIYYGFVAQEVEQVYPSMVHWIPDPTDENKSIKGLAYLELIAPLVRAVQEQQKEIEKLQARVAQLEGR